MWDNFARIAIINCHIFFFWRTRWYKANSSSSAYSSSSLLYCSNIAWARSLYRRLFEIRPFYNSVVDRGITPVSLAATAKRPFSHAPLNIQRTAFPYIHTHTGKKVDFHLPLYKVMQAYILYRQFEGQIYLAIICRQLTEDYYSCSRTRAHKNQSQNIQFSWKFSCIHFYWEIYCSDTFGINHTNKYWLHSAEWKVFMYMFVMLW